MAIDDYIDPSKPISISNKEVQNMKAVYEVLRKQKEDERAKIGVPSKKKSLRNVNSKNGKAVKPLSKPPVTAKSAAPSKPLRPATTKTHVDDKGRNSDTRTLGQFDNLRKNALKKDEEKIQRG